MARRVLIVLLAVLVFAPGCGGDDEPEASPPLPDLTVPQTDAAPPADSPAERFEDFCNENPGSRGCG